MSSGNDDPPVPALSYEAPGRRRRGFVERLALGLAVDLLAGIGVLLCIAGIGLIALLNLGSAWTFICTFLFLAAMASLWRLMRRWTQ